MSGIENAESASKRYSRIAITLHWLMAIAIVWQIWMGLWMVDALNEPETQAAAYDTYQLHKSLGLTLLVLAILRLGWRLGHKAPAMPSDMPKWQVIAARFTHIFLYAIMLLIPLTGWAYVSTGWNSSAQMAFSVPTVWFNQFEWPHIPGIDGNSGLADIVIEAHEILAFATILLLVLHIGAALKHHLINRDNVLASMVPFIRRK